MTLRPTQGHPEHSRGTTDDELRRFLQSALPRVKAATPRDAWPEILARVDARPAWSLFDTALAAGIVTALLLVPEALFLIALHL